ESGLGPNRGAESPSQGLAGQLGRVQLGGTQTPELFGDLRGSHGSGVEHVRPTDQGHGGAGRRRCRPTTASLETSPGYAIVLDGDREGDLVAARPAARGDGARPSGDNPKPLGRGQVMLESERV